MRNQRWRASSICGRHATKISTRAGVSLAQVSTKNPGANIPIDAHAEVSSHDKIRKLTWPLHKRLDQLPQLKRLLQPDCGLDDYRRFLLKMATFYRTYQPLVFDSVGALAPDDLALRDKLGALQRDLDGLGAGGVHDLAPMTPDTACFKHRPAAALGALYVMEGSTQGGQLLRRKMLERFARTDIVQFFDVYKQHNGQRWQDFLDHFNRNLSTPEQVDQAAAGAGCLYRVLIDLFGGRADID